MIIVLVVGTASTLYLVANHYVSSMKRIHDPFSSIPAALRPPQATGAAAKDMTILVEGVDSRSPATSDIRSAKSLMLMHFIAGGHGAYVVSIPGDSWVPIPGHGSGMIKWAYSLGGPTLAVRTVENLARVRIDHVAIIDWAGFRAVTDALGGVTVNVPATYYDPANHVTWTAGTHRLNGAQALRYVSAGNDQTQGELARARRQQYFLHAVLTQLRAEGKLTNPLQIGSVLRALSQAVSVDTTMTNGQITDLALGLRRLSLNNVVFATAPSSASRSADGHSVLHPDDSIGPGYWHAFEYDSLPRYIQAHGLTQLGSSTP